MTQRPYDCQTINYYKTKKNQLLQENEKKQYIERKMTDENEKSNANEQNRNGGMKELEGKKN